MKAEPNLQKAIEGRNKNPRVGIRYKDQDGLVMRVGFKSLSDDERAVLLRWYRLNYFTQKELARMFGVGIGIVSKAVRAFSHKARKHHHHNRQRYA